NSFLRERLSEHPRVLIHNAKSATEDRRERAPVLFQGNDSGRGKVPHKQRERFARSAAELVDRLIRIAHGKNVRLRSGEQRQDLDLGKIRVLKFIHQQKAGAAAFLFEFRLLLRAGNTGKRDLAAFKALNVERVLCRADQFVLATTHEIEQAIEK